MAEKTSIEWTESTWTPVKGCTRKSPGCVNCYAEIMAARFSKPGQWGEGLAKIVSVPGGRKDHRWTGVMRFDEKELLKPLDWKKPRKIFVCSTSDLFHEDVLEEWIDQVFAVMALAPQHTYQVLTKRPERMREYLASIENGDDERLVGMRDAMVEGSAQSIWHARTGDNTVDEWLAVHLPLNNVWLGTSIEDRVRLEERAPILADIDWPTKFWSAEPLLGDLGHIPVEWIPDWVIVGGESGPGWRPMNELWAEKVLHQVKNAGKAAFMKQMAGKAPIPSYLMVREMPHGR